MRRHLLFALILLLLFSCKKKSRENNPETVIPETPASERVSTSSPLNVYSSALLKVGIAQFAPELQPLTPKIKYNVSTYKIVYKTSYKNHTIWASGIVCIPEATTSLSLLSFQHGTMFSNVDVPSNNSNQQFQIAALASVGYVVIAPDYLGFGSSDTIAHPYYIASYSANAVRDMILATQELLPSLKVSLNGKLFLGGYSQGGNATMAALKDIENLPIQGLSITASGAGAGGYDLKGIFETIVLQEKYTSPNYLGYVVHSFQRSYHLSVPFSYYFKEPYATRIPILYDGNTDGNTINSQLNTSLDSLFQSSFLEGLANDKEKQFDSLLKANSLHDWKPSTPLRFYHGTVDEIVPYSDTDSTYQKMLQKGAEKISLVPLQGKNHSTGALPMMADLINWFETF